MRNKKENHLKEGQPKVMNNIENLLKKVKKESKKMNKNKQNKIAKIIFNYIKLIKWRKLKN